MQTNIMKDYLHSLNHEVTEVRILRKEPYLNRQYTGTIVSGYYTPDHYDKLLSDIVPYEQDAKTTCIWTTLQAANPALLARAANRLRQNAKTTTEDNNISNFVVFPIDIDSDNPTDTSASLTEMMQTKERAMQVYEILTEELDLPVVKAMSGNGFHMLIYLSEPFPCNEENAIRFKASGDIAKALWNTDEKNYNPARCWKLYGTTVRKGDSTEDRPHRVSEIWLPDEIERVPFQEIETRLISIAPEIEEKPKPKQQRKTRSAPTAQGKRLPSLDTRQDLENLARECGAVPNANATWKQKADYEIIRTFCPLCNREDHGKLTYGSGGECGYSCHSNTCSGKNFQDLYERAGYTKSEYQGPPPREYNNFSGDAKEQARQQVQDDFGTEKPTFTIVDTSKEKPKIPVFPSELIEIFPFKPYIKAFEGKTEVCPAFHFAALKTGIAAILGRRVYIDALHPIFPNFYTCICGQTGASRKSTALGLIENLLHEETPTVFQLDALATPEGLVRSFMLPKDMEHGYELNEYYDESNPIGIDRYLGGDRELLNDILMESEERWEGFRGFAIIDEISGLLKKAKKAGSEGLIQKLGQFYDNKRIIRNPSSTSPTIAYNPSLSIAGATTLEWLEEELKPEDIRGGLGRRLAFYADEGEVTDIDLPEAADPELLKVAQSYLGKLRGEMYKEPTGFTYKPEAREKQKAWYKEYREGVRAEKDALLKAASQGLDTHFKKAALLFAVVDNSDNEATIKEKHIDWAILLAEYLKECQHYIFVDFASSEREKLDRQVIDTLSKKAWQSSRDLYRKLKVDSETMRRTLESLIQMRVIGVDKTGKVPKYAVIDKEQE